MVSTAAMSTLPISIYVRKKLMTIQKAEHITNIFRGGKVAVKN
jgi:ArsR family metal-binding transcriptional regulator